MESQIKQPIRAKRLCEAASPPGNNQDFRKLISGKTSVGTGNKLVLVEKSQPAAGLTGHLTGSGYFPFFFFYLGAEPEGGELMVGGA